MAGLDQYLTKWSFLQVVWTIVEPVARILSAHFTVWAARFTVWASRLASATEENAQELEGGLLGADLCKIPPPYSVSGALSS